MKGSPPEDASTGDESSDIRTVRSNATHIFSTASYYTNPTLPASILERLESDEISSLGGDFASPTSIMTNYESYSKFGAAPIYQTLPSKPSVSSNIVSNRNELKTIAEESPAVYQAPSFYKSQRRSEGKRHGENISNIAISASQSIAASSKSNEDGSILTEKTTASSSRSSTAAQEEPVETKHPAPVNTLSRMFQRIASSSKSPARHRTASPVPESAAEPKLQSPVAPVVPSARHAAKSARKSPSNSMFAASSSTTGRESPPVNRVALPQSILVLPGHVPSGTRPTTPTEPIRISESQASTPKAGVNTCSSPAASAAEGYINPTLKSVSSKLFVQEAAVRDPAPLPTLNLAAVDGEASPKKFRLWTDEDSAIGATWYDFPQGTSFFAASPPAIQPTAASPPTMVTPADRVPPDTPSTLTTDAAMEPSVAAPQGRVPPDTPSTLTAPEAPAVGPKLSLSRLQLKQMHRGTSTGTVTITDEDTMNSRGGYPSMVSSEYEDEGGTYQGDTDDITTLGGGPSLDFSVSACLDEDSPDKTAARSTMVYSNVGQAFSRSDLAPPVRPQNTLALPSLTLDRPARVRRSSSLSTSKHSSTLEIIDEYGAPVANPSPPPGESSMMVVSLAEASRPSSSGRSSVRAEIREKVVVIRRLDAFQIGMIVLISVALTAVICATFCLVGSCQVRGRRRMLLRGAGIPQSPPTGVAASVDQTASLFSLPHGN